MKSQARQIRFRNCIETSRQVRFAYWFSEHSAELGLEMCFKACHRDVKSRLRSFHWCTLVVVHNRIATFFRVILSRQPGVSQAVRKSEIHIMTSA